MPAFCVQCGTAIKPNMRFCEECGTQVNSREDSRIVRAKSTFILAAVTFVTILGMGALFLLTRREVDSLRTKNIEYETTIRSLQDENQQCKGRLERTQATANVQSPDGEIRDLRIQATECERNLGATKLDRDTIRQVDAALREEIRKLRNQLAEVMGENQRIKGLIGR